MTWFKFLAPGAAGPFSGSRWPSPLASDVPGEWMTWDKPMEPCRGGLHLLRQADLPFWIHEELYVVEAEGAVVEQESFVLARRARLVRRVEAWGREAAYRFSGDCAWRVRGQTARALRRDGRNQDADLLVACGTMDDLRGTTRRLGNGDASRPGRLLGYVGDAATYAASVETGTGWAAAAATTAFIAAAAARFASGTAGGRAASVERNQQARWLADNALADRL